MYVDTSVLAADYCPEPLSDQAERLLLDMDRPAISQLTAVELASAVARKMRMGELSRLDGPRILDLFRTHEAQDAYLNLPVRAIHYARARLFVAADDVSLRTLDALHLAIAEENDLSMLTADGHLAAAAAPFGIDVRLAVPGTNSNNTL